MRIFYLVSLMLFSLMSAFAQRANGPVRPVLIPSKIIGVPATQSVPTDTLWGIFPLGSNSAAGTATPTLYPVTGGGFVSGSNSYGDFTKAQAFTLTSAYTVEGCIFWFGAKKVTSGNLTSKVVAAVYEMDGTGVLSTGSGACPGSVVASTKTDILVSAIDTSAPKLGFVYVHFPTPYNPSGDYAIGIDLTKLAAGDSVALTTSSVNQSGMIDQSFDQWSDGTWHSEAEPSNWNLNIDMAVFPLINKGAGIAESGFINGLKLYQNYPNPFTVSSTISYELQNNAANLTFFIQDVDGNLVRKLDLGRVEKGKHTLDLSGEDLASGSYFFLMQADHSRLAEKMTVIR